MTHNLSSIKYSWLLVVVLVLTSILPLVTGEVQTLGTFPQGSCINLKQICSNCTYNNITTIISPNSTQLLGEKSMTKVGTDYNYTFCNTTLIGQYIVNGKGDLDGVLTVWTYNFFVTPTGYEVSIANSIVMFFLILLFGLVTIGFFWFGLTQQNIPLKVFFVSLGVLFLIFDVGVILGVANVSIGQFTGILSIFNSIYILGTILLSAGAIILIVFVIKYILELFHSMRGYDIG